MKKYIGRLLRTAIFCFIVLLNAGLAEAQKAAFHVIAFFTARNDLAHISFVHEANRWFDSISHKHGFTYDSTSDWTKLSSVTPDRYQVVIFLDTRVEDFLQRSAFEKYMKNGGGWMGFHFSAFSLAGSAFPDNWKWYHDEFLGCGEYVSNTWRPTAAVLRVENNSHPVTKRLPVTFRSAPNEWYRWTNDLRSNASIRILLSIDSSSFPLGTGPKPYEIWHSGYYPVAWTNINYRMVYFNMGHNDMDYENKTNARLSSTFSSSAQNQAIINALLWLGNK